MAVFSVPLSVPARMQSLTAASILLTASVLIPSVYSDLLCPKPKVPSYGYIAKGYQNTYEVGSVVVYACKSGYTMVGSSTIKCLKIGFLEYWSRHPPRCKKC